VTFLDHFSGHAADYREFRPRYPAALFQWLASRAPEPKLAWDAGCGNGQASLGLAGHFDRVIATDASAEQLRQAAPHPRIEYVLTRSEESHLTSGSVDLVCVAQALHWFEFAPFHAEVKRVAKPRGVYAAIAYDNCSVNSAVDAVMDRFQAAVEPYWNPERRHVVAGLRTVPIPFTEEFTPPHFELESELNLAGYAGYLSTWSAVKNHLRTTGVDPVMRFLPEFRAAWGDAQALRPVRWHLHLRVGTVN
jgi:SAM-dependent methyltransferase